MLDRTIRDHNYVGWGPITFLEGIQRSSNTAMALRILGLVKLLDLMSGEAKGILFSKENFGPVEHATTSFGQGISVTPIQQITAVAAAVNGGKLFTPYVVSKVYDSETGKVTLENTPTLKKQVISEET
ncbi:penicillin-binding transpeptidase domain-containing protein [Ureibacillus acetophenoni]